MNFRTIVLTIYIGFHANAYPQKKNIENPLPNKAQLAWQKAELGAVFHYDLHVFDNKKYKQAGSSGNRLNPVKDYQIFNPKQLDTDQWIKAIKKAGFKFAILTATHETGFALYPSTVSYTHLTLPTILLV